MAAVTGIKIGDEVSVHGDGRWPVTHVYGDGRLVVTWVHGKRLTLPVGCCEKIAPPCHPKAGSVWRAEEGDLFFVALTGQLQRLGTEYVYPPGQAQRTFGPLVELVPRPTVSLERLAQAYELAHEATTGCSIGRRRTAIVQAVLAELGLDVSDG